MGGRTDANNGNGTQILAPREYYNATLISVLLNETGIEEPEYKAEGKDVYMMDTDLALLAAPERCSCSLRWRASFSSA
ncbi:Catalase/peroxidase HPI [Phytophthora cinnamomi]|uniref:Catalase/peroxidase HPI n=1 Tax=Phytophthora cinnamomi TaxID=4785 RepID=UPI003559B0A2|nr:Catalase/peroxidase HPI [Phytophthora cinnamomi]